MPEPMSAAQFLAALKNEGVSVIETDGWATHNRNSKGPWGLVHGVMVHHTVTRGTQKTVGIVRDGYAGLPGPLCHGMVAKDGTVHLIGYGRTNHAGLGDPNVLAAVIAERILPVDQAATVDGNRHFYGLECENLGDGSDPWPEVQLDAIARIAAAVCRHHEWGPLSVIGHLEWQPGKPDPRGFSMASMRERVRARLLAGTVCTVKAGDTLSGIAKSLGVSTDALFAANRDRIRSADLILPGQELAVPPVSAPPEPVKPKVDLSLLIAAAKGDPKKSGTPVTYNGTRTVEAALVNEGLLSKTRSDGHYGTTTVTAYAAWQKKCGVGGPYDGIPGIASLTRLGGKHGFTVSA